MTKDEQKILDFSRWFKKWVERRMGKCKVFQRGCVVCEFNRASDELSSVCSRWIEDKKT